MVRLRTHQCGFVSSIRTVLRQYFCRVNSTTIVKNPHSVDDSFIEKRCFYGKSPHRNYRLQFRSFGFVSGQQPLIEPRSERIVRICWYPSGTTSRVRQPRPRGGRDTLRSPWMVRRERPRRRSAPTRFGRPPRHHQFVIVRLRLRLIGRVPRPSKRIRRSADSWASLDPESIRSAWRHCITNFRPSIAAARRSVKRRTSALAINWTTTLNSSYTIDDM